MKWIFLKYMVIYGILLLCFVQENESNFDQPIEANFDLNQNANQITVVGSIYSTKNIQNVRITIEIFGDDRSFIFNLFDIAYNLPANKSITLREMNNRNDIVFPLEYLYGKYIVIMKISGGIPSVGTISIEKDFQTELTLFNTGFKEVIS
ncbi:MAG: hypothetical protein PVF58_22725 [Candidatus Methanofastidiosia archaeon]|jgi:hypothetical protein